MWLYHRVMSPNDAVGMANSVDPDQTSPLGAVWSGSALFAQTYLSKNLGKLRYAQYYFVITWINTAKCNKVGVYCSICCPYSLKPACSIHLSAGWRGIGNCPIEWTSIVITSLGEAAGCFAVCLRAFPYFMVFCSSCCRRRAAIFDLSGDLFIVQLSLANAVVYQANMRAMQEQLSTIL